MGRIRTIKPEFPHSESIGKLSRNARLLFVMLWTIVDDTGRTRAASRMLASLLYPYDDDAAEQMDGWLDELETNGHIRRYEVKGSTYLDIPNWLEHQKIDHPTKSRLPAYSEALANPREPSRILAPDLGPVPRTMDHEREGAREALVSSEAFELTDDIAKAQGVDRDEPALVGFPMRVQCWLTQGIPRDFILATCARFPGKHQNYLDKAVTNGWAEQKITPSTGKPLYGKPGNVIPAADRLVAKLAEFDRIPGGAAGEGAGGGAGLRGGEGAAHVRLLSEG